MTLSGREEQSYGKRVRESLRELFAVIHRREKMSAAGFQQALEAAREQVMKAATTRVPTTRPAQNLAKRFHQHGEAYFRFITTPGIEPINNLAEQTIRFVVVDRRITQGTRSETGRHWCERIWTVIATCAQQSRSVFKFLLGSGSCSFRRRFAALAPAVRPLTAFFFPLFLLLLRISVVILRHPVNAYEKGLMVIT